MLNETKTKCIITKWKYRARKIWTLTNGPIEKGLCVLHKCDNPYCINLQHLFLGTHKENTQDMLKKGRHWVQQGEQHYRCKLTDVQIQEIREKYKFRGKNHNNGPSLAVKYGVSEQEITKIARGYRSATGTEDNRSSNKE